MKELIDQFEAGAAKLKAAVSGLSAREFDWVPPADAGLGTWTIREVAIHLQDSDLIGVDRMKRIAAEPNPLLVGYDENLFARTLAYAEQSVDDACAVFELNRRQFVRALRKLPAEAFVRSGIHTETGKVTLESELKKYIWHLEHHLEFIRKKRAKLGK